MEYKPKSGSQKRKEKAEKEKREQESSVNQKTLDCLRESKPDIIWSKKAPASIRQMILMLKSLKMMLSLIVV